MAIDALQTTYYLLYAKYGNSPIGTTDKEQFKYKIFSVIFEYGPSWKQKLNIQQYLQNLDITSEEILKGTQSIYNSAQNPEGPPTASTYQALDGINSQNVSAVKRGKLEPLQYLYTLLETDITAHYIERFKNCFRRWVSPDLSRLYYPIPGTYLEPDPENNFLSDYGKYSVSTFQEVWPSYEEFKADYENCGIPTTI